MSNLGMQYATATKTMGSGARTPECEASLSDCLFAVSLLTLGKSLHLSVPQLEKRKAITVQPTRSQSMVRIQ